MRNYLLALTAFLAIAACHQKPRSQAPSRPTPIAVGKFSGAIDQAQEAVIIGDMFAGVTCAGANDGAAFCEADGTIVFCTQESWRNYTCDPGWSCDIEDDDVVNCFPKNPAPVDIEGVTL